MWRELIDAHWKVVSYDEGAAWLQIREVEEAFSLAFPDELHSFLTECNGAKDEYGCDLIWSVERIRKENIFYRTSAEYKELFMPFDHLFFIADAGNGDLFGYAIHNGRIRRTDIFTWNHEDDSRTWVAPSLNVFVKWWASGDIKI